MELMRESLPTVRSHSYERRTSHICDTEDSCTPGSLDDAVRARMVSHLVVSNARNEAKAGEILEEAWCDQGFGVSDSRKEMMML